METCAIISRSASSEPDKAGWQTKPTQTKSPSSTPTEYFGRWSCSSGSKSRGTGSDGSDLHHSSTSDFTGAAGHTETSTSPSCSVYTLCGLAGGDILEPRGSEYPSYEITPRHDVPYDAPVLKKLGSMGFENTHITQATQPKQHTSLTNKSVNTHDLEVIYFSDLSWEKQSQSFKDFQEDPAHKFWTWDRQHEQWFHRDEDTGSVIWCPTELD